VWVDRFNRLSIKSGGCNCKHSNKPSELRKGREISSQVAFVIIFKLLRSGSYTIPIAID
jgi:hypothetical protein